MNKNHLLLVILVAVVVILGAYWIVASKTSQVPVEADQPASTSADGSPTVTSQTPIATSGENPQPGSIHDMPVEPAAAAARKDLAAKLGVVEKSIVIMLVEEVTWSDGCLGLGGPAESCLQARVPGFRVEMLAQGKTHLYRTNKNGTVIRAETK